MKIFTIATLLSCAGLLAPAHSAACVTWTGYCAVICSNATCPDSDYVTFYLNTRANPTVGQVIDLNANNLSASNFVASKPTKIIVHGLNGSADNWHYVAMRKEFLTKGDYNLITVDWTVLAKGGFLLCLPTATVNAKHVGVCIGGLVKALRQAGATDIHIIGHSLGAFVAGYAGQAVLPNLVPRITGLDPTNWLYSSAYADRLQTSFATFLDVIHTNLNDGDTVGHADFYVNGGFTQPGCPLIDPESNIIFCSHWRSVVYFTESINSATGFYGWACPTWTAPIGGVCLFHGGRSILMGNGASTSTRGVIQLNTYAAAPFAMGQ